MKKLLVLCADYNGCKNIQFMMDLDDPRIDGVKWTLLDSGKYSKGILTTSKGLKFKVWADWSLTQI